LICAEEAERKKKKKKKNQTFWFLLQMPAMLSKFSFFRKKTRTHSDGNQAHRQGIQSAKFTQKPSAAIALK
jgi:hypothetical protein